MLRTLAAGFAAATLIAGAAGAGDAVAATCSGATAGPDQANRAQVAQATLCLVNEQRRGHGLHTLRPNRRLAAAARRHSRDMVRRGYFAHTAPGGTTLVDRIRHSGYLRSAGRWHLGEDLGWGSGPDSTADAIVRAWMQSPPHRKAILTAAFREAGVGVVLGVPVPGGGSGATYTLDFGVRH
jgi:uncharacterized protein YkwD